MKRLMHVTDENAKAVLDPQPLAQLPSSVVVGSESDLPGKGKEWGS